MVVSTILSCFRKAWPTSVSTTLWLLKLMIPITFTVKLLQFYGIIEWMAHYLDPLFVYIGLPGYSAIAFLTGAFVTTYAGIAVMLSLVLTMRQATIIGIMICICHALFMESAVVKKTGSSFTRMAVIRFILAFVVGAYLNFVLPAETAGAPLFGQNLSGGGADVMPDTLMLLLQSWVLSTLKMSAMIFALIYALMLVQRLLEAYGMIEVLSRWFAPLMIIFGLPRNAAYMWVVGNVLGISYGSAVMMDLEERGIITREEANDVNYHLIMNHSMLEDTCVFAALGIPALWILSTRMLFALILVWSRKLMYVVKTIRS